MPSPWERERISAIRSWRWLAGRLASMRSHPGQPSRGPKPRIWPRLADRAELTADIAELALWLEGGARPVEQVAMTANGSINTAAAAKLPPVIGTPVFLTPTQATGAATYLAAHWAQAIK